MEQIDNPPAFPNIAGSMVYSNGMSLRDYFAAKAMQGIISAVFSHESGIDITQTAGWSYSISDAMLAARMKPNKEE